MSMYGPYWEGQRSGGASVIVASKGVKGQEMRHDIVLRPTDEDSIKKLVGDFKEQSTRVPLERLDLSENCRNWITELVGEATLQRTQKDTAIKYLEFLLTDFTHSLKTRMREEDKHGIGILTEDWLIICHSRSDELTITPEWSVVRRALDSDNVERFVIFGKHQGAINAWYYEYYKSESLILWLGLPESDASHYLGGKNRFLAVVEQLDLAIEISDDQVEEFFFGDRSPLDANKNRIALSKPIHSIDIKQVKMGKATFRTLSDFRQAFIGKRMDLNYYHAKFLELRSKVEFLTGGFVDTDSGLIRQDASGERNIISKFNRFFTVVYAGIYPSPAEKPNMEIAFKSSFLDMISEDLVNNRPSRIYHAASGLYVVSDQFKLGNTLIYNCVTTDDRYRELDRILQNNAGFDQLIRKILLFVTLLHLSRIQDDPRLAYLFSKLADNIKLSDGVQLVLQNENAIFEYKSRDVLVGTNDEIAETLSADMVKKLQGSPFKVYIIGVDERSQRLEPITGRG